MAAMIDLAELEGLDDEDLPPTLENVIEQESLRWVFVGGKGGVGKTTTSCSLALQLAAARERVLIVSTDPAHNLSDAFGQKFGPEPSKVNAWKKGNVFCAEMDSKAQGDKILAMMKESAGADSGGFMEAIASAFSQAPGVDELMSFGALMKNVQSMHFSVVVFDTAPTGHTLRLLGIPATMSAMAKKMSDVSGKLSGLMGQMASMMGGGGAGEGMMGQLKELKQTAGKVEAIMKDPEKTTFVCVCIPEFLSIYETERLVQTLSELDIDTHNIVVNQILDDDEVTDCTRCSKRVAMQQKYLEQMMEVYGADFHVVKMPLLDGEVRGVDNLLTYGSKLITPHVFSNAVASTNDAAVAGGAGGGAGAS